MRFLLLLLLLPLCTSAQSRIDSFRLFGDVRVTADLPEGLKPGRPRMLVLYALPNGNSTEWTRGKKPKAGDDWHFDIQHIEAQTAFVRSAMKDRDIIVVYLESNAKSWPAWKKQHTDHPVLIPAIVDHIKKRYGNNRTKVCLSAHSGGGSFIFGYLQAVAVIPRWVERISFLDANYGYDSSYAPKLVRWMERNPRSTFLTFAYNDSVALYNDKPLVSPTGGTWYRSHRMMEDLRPVALVRSDSLLFYEGRNRQLAFFLRTNPDRKIYHTQQVEYNGFIHTLLYRTAYEHQGYQYYEARAYTRFLNE